MSQEEKNRLVSDVMKSPLMIAEAMKIKDKAGMEKFITSKGYDLTDQEMEEVMAMAKQFMGRS